MDYSEAPIPKVVHIKDKAPQKATRGKQGWKSSERKHAKWLVDNDAPDLSPLIRSVQSVLKDGSVSGRVGHQTGLQFDCVSETYAGENKQRTLPVWLWTAWVQICQLAFKYNKEPVLFLDFTTDQSTMVVDGKKVKVPVMHAITSERHSQLLQYEKIVRSAQGA